MAIDKVEEVGSRPFMDEVLDVAWGFTFKVRSMRLADGSWHIQAEGPEGGIIEVDGKELRPTLRLILKDILERLPAAKKGA